MHYSTISRIAKRSAQQLTSRSKISPPIHPAALQRGCDVTLPLLPRCGPHLPTGYASRPLGRRLVFGTSPDPDPVTEGEGVRAWVLTRDASPLLGGSMGVPDAGIVALALF